MIILQETFSTLLHDQAHWEFELLVGLLETIVIDVVLILFVWKGLIKPYLAKRKKDIIAEEHKRHGIRENHE